MRKFTFSAVSILFLMAYGMVVLHNIVPHQHQTENHEVADHHVHDDHHAHHHDHHSEPNEEKNSSESPSDLSHPFMGQGHFEEIFQNQVSFKLIAIDTKVLPPSSNFFYSSSFDQLQISQVFEGPPILYEPPPNASDPLRGPPSIV